MMMAMKKMSGGPWPECGRRVARAGSSSAPFKPSEGSGRLAAVLLTYAFAFLVNSLFYHGLIFFDEARRLSWGVPETITVLAVGHSILLVFLLKRRKIPESWIPTIGAVFQISGAFFIALIEYCHNSIPLGSNWRVEGISWICVWIVVYPLIMQTTPIRTALVALGSATMGPLVYITLAAKGDIGVPENVGSHFAANYICVALAAYAAKVISFMQTKLAEATQMGSYELKELLGRGGMGEVWTAEHRLLTRPAAIKLISTKKFGGPSQGQEIVKRFKREAQATAALHSAHTINLFDFGVTNEGIFYYVMELLDGMDLEEIIRKHGPMSAARTAFIVEQICHSLADAHEMGMIHRDVKPANVFLCRMGRDFDFVKVLDFGLVKAVNKRVAGDEKLTMAHAATGTPAFMAPEMADGAAVDHRVDIYGLGCVAYWMLTGHLVFEADSPMRLIAQHLQETPEAPSTRTEIEVPEELDALILSCLSKDPGQRPQSAEELAAGLRKIRYPERWEGSDAQAWWHRHQPKSSVQEKVESAAAETVAG